MKITNYITCKEHTFKSGSGLTNWVIFPSRALVKLDSKRENTDFGAPFEEKRREAPLETSGKLRLKRNGKRKLQQI